MGHLTSLAFPILGNLTKNLGSRVGKFAFLHGGIKLRHVVPCAHLCWPYGLWTKCEVKMAGYWPSSFFACLWTETKSSTINLQKKNEANIQPS